MSKETKAKVGLKTTREGGMLTHLAKLAAAKAAELLSSRSNIAVFAGVIMLLAWLLSDSAGGISTAMLYMVANNERRSGRADGNVFMRNGRVRRFVVPALIQNAATSAARALLAMLSTGWNALSQADMISWNGITWLYRSDRFAVPQLIKGKAAYVMLNANLINVGAVPITSAPLDSGGVPGITAATVTPDQSTDTMSTVFSPTPTDAGVTHLVFATRPLSAGTFRPRLSDFRLISTLGGTSASPAGFAVAYTTKFGSSWSTNAGYVGGKIFFKFVPINIETGVEGGNLIVESIIQA